MAGLELEATSELIPDRKLVEAEHGPVVALQHPHDKRVFGFKVITIEVYEAYRLRKERGDTNALERLLQERAVWPSRESWNQYVADAVFETLAFEVAYRKAHGGTDVRLADDDEVPEDGNPEWRWLTNRKDGEGQVFGFRKPGRAEIKMFQAQVLARGRGERVPDPIETLLRNCGTPEFGAWLTANPFGIDTFGEAFVSAYGMQEARVTPK